MRDKRAKAHDTAVNMLARPLAIFDTETTGVGPEAEIVEIAIVDNAGKVLLDSLVKPTSPIPAEVTAIHGITDADVAGAPTILELWPQIEAAFDGRTLTSYNLAFDLRMIQQSLRHAGINHLYSRRVVFTGNLRDELHLCIMDMYAPLYGAWNFQYQSYTWQSLGNAVEQCGLDSFSDGAAHRALADARAALDVLKYMGRTE